MQAILNILVTVYKRDFHDSETLTNIADIAKSGIFKNAKLIVWDNSPLKIVDTEINLLRKSFLDIFLEHTPQNQSLSKIYNAVINKYVKKDEYLILLDHDTRVTAAYFNELIENINIQEPPELLLPQIFVNNIIESPAYQYILFSKKWKLFNNGLYSSKSVTAINSGMVISEHFFSQGFRYDENLLFYGTDSYFMYHYSNYNSKFYLLNARLEHDLNLQSNSSVDQKVKIFKAIKNANLIVYSSNPFFFTLTRVNNIIIAIKYSIRYLSLNFFK